MKNIKLERNVAKDEGNLNTKEIIDLKNECNCTFQDCLKCHMIEQGCVSYWLKDIK